MSLTQVAFLLFAAIAAGGLTMAAIIAFGKSPPSFMGPGHGIGGLVACATLFVANLRGGAVTPEAAWWALIVFTSGLAGGLLLFRVLFKGATPLILVAGHGSVAALGLYLLYPLTGF